MRALCVAGQRCAPFVWLGTVPLCCCTRTGAAGALSAARATLGAGGYQTKAWLDRLLGRRRHASIRWA